ncbi:DEAD/DEAH box helicase family protein [Patescibacteria group bacterium]|nr:DEAD/DEAH box helicase family protein [Patescibacteria group bacterium]
MPVDMATGSGKTATVGVHLHKMFRFRDKLEKLNNRKYPLDVLVLNDRINLVNQIKADFIDGRDSKLPLLGEDIAKHAKIKLFHSKADSTETIQVTD